ncbi:MAG: asparaginase [Planctomycetota bacterium]
MAGRKPKLCVITTGGTIGMVRDADGFAQPTAPSTNQPTLPDASALPEASDAFPGLGEMVGDRYDLRIFPLMDRDSTNMLPSDWTLIARTIRSFSPQDFDGFVVTHGTDTLAHSASAVAFALGPPPLPTPVVFTGAMRTPGDPGYDGLANLAGAYHAAASDLGEVSVAFHGKLLRATRTEKISATELDAFASPEPNGIGRVGDVAELNKHAARRDKSQQEWSKEFSDDFSPSIAAITLTPGLAPTLYESLLDRNHCRGVILTALGAGHVPDRPGSDWTAWIASARKANIPVVLSSPFRGGRTDRSAYAVGRSTAEAGAIPLADLTQPCVHVKLRYLIAASDKAGVEACTYVQAAVAQNQFGELGGPIKNV